MSKWVLESWGDNRYRVEFSSKYGVTSHLYKILENIENGDWDSYPLFDIEDDKIEVTSPNGKKYACYGWHWAYEPEHPDLMMPDGETFYTKVSKLN